MRKEKKKQDLENDPPGRLLASLAVPSIIAMMVNGLYYLVDAAFVGWSEGGMALAGLATIFPLQMFMIAWGTMLGMGAASLISHRMGEAKNQEARNAAGSGVFLALLSGVILTVLSLVFRPALLNLLGATEVTRIPARSYLIGLEPGFVFVFLSMVGFNLVRAEGLAKEAGMGMLLGSLVNLVLDPVFLFVLHTGVIGAAWATVLARVLSTLYIVFVLAKKKNVLGLRLGRVTASDAARIFSLGIGMFLSQVGLSVLAVLMNRSLRRMGSAADIAAYGILSRIHVFVTMPLLGLAQGFQPIAGFNAGAGRWDRVNKLTWLTFLTAVIFGAAMLIPSMTIPGTLMHAFTADTDVIAAGTGPLRITLCLLPLIGMQVIGFTYFQALGNPAGTLILSLSRQVLFLIPFLMIFPVYWGMNGLWSAYPAADFTAALLSVIMVGRNIRNKSRMAAAAVRDDVMG